MPSKLHEFGSECHIFIFVDAKHHLHPSLHEILKFAFTYNWIYKDIMLYIGIYVFFQMSLMKVRLIYEYRLYFRCVGSLRAVIDYGSHVS